VDQTIGLRTGICSMFSVILAVHEALIKPHLRVMLVTKRAKFLARLGSRHRPSSRTPPNETPVGGGVPVGHAGSVRFWSRTPVRTFIRQRRSGVKSHKNVSEKLLDSRTVLFINQRHKPTKISTGDKSVPAIRPYKNRRIETDCPEKGFQSCRQS
jgi:hypothetical protein